MYNYRLEEIGASASKEYSLEKAMDKMKTEWKDMCFNFIAYRDTVRYCIFPALEVDPLLHRVCPFCHQWMISRCYWMIMLSRHRQ